MNHTAIDNIQNYLFSTPEEMEKASVPSNVRERIVRIRDVYNHWLLYPHKSDSEISQYIRDVYKLGVTQSYDDLNIIKICLGSFQISSRGYDQWKFRQMIDQAWEVALKNEDAAAMAKLTASYGKFTQLDKEVAATPVYPTTPDSITMSGDPSLVGIKPLPNWRKIAKKMMEKYTEQQYVEYVEEKQE